MTQLEKLKELLDNPTLSDVKLQFMLDSASDLICELRNTNSVETHLLNIQLKMAMEMYSKLGAEGQLAHGENGINRTYNSSDFSLDLIRQISPFAKTPFSSKRVF
jgi:hypothetical protein